MDKGKYNNLLNYNDLFKIINQLIILNDYISTSYIVLIVINIENHLIGSWGGNSGLLPIVLS